MSRRDKPKTRLTLTRMAFLFDPSKVKVTWGPHEIKGFAHGEYIQVSRGEYIEVTDTSSRGAAVASTDSDPPGFAAARDRFVQVLAELEHLDPGCTHPCDDASGRARFSFGYALGRRWSHRDRKLYLELTWPNHSRTTEDPRTQFHVSLFVRRVDELKQRSEHVGRELAPRRSARNHALCLCCEHTTR